MRCWPGLMALAVWRVDEFTQPAVSANKTRAVEAANFIVEVPFRGGKTRRRPELGTFCMRVWVIVVSVLLALGAMTPAHADQRYAVLIGASPGWSRDRRLGYAENDAERMRDVLVRLGSFAPDHVSLLRDPDTNEVRAT